MTLIAAVFLRAIPVNLISKEYNVESVILIATDRTANTQVRHWSVT